MNGPPSPRADTSSDPAAPPASDGAVDPTFDLTVDLILASASPRRRELLQRLGLVLKVAPVDLDETPISGEKAADYVRRVAGAKCDAAVATLPAGTPGLVTVLGADTIVNLGGEILGKPRDADDARVMLGRLAGRRHEVTTAYRIWRGRAGTGTKAASDGSAARIIDRAVTTQVSFRLLQPAEIDAYVDSGEWEGKAGGYAVQGIAAAFTNELRGSHTNVIGLPLAEVMADLLAAGALGTYPRAGFRVPGAGGPPVPA
jgi:septum formation protein